PVPAVKAFRSVSIDAPFTQTDADITVGVRPVPDPDRLQVQVVDPDSYERVRDTFNPFSHPGVVDSTVLLVDVANSGRGMGTVPAGGHLTGYLAVSNSLLNPGSWTLTFPALHGSQGSFPGFKFIIQVS